MNEIPSFSAAIDVTPAGKAGQYRARIDENWTIGGKPNGGYLMAVLAEAAAQEIAAQGKSHTHCIISATTFVGSPNAVESEVTVFLLRAGLGTTQVHATLSQGAGVLVDATMTFTRLHTDAPRNYDALDAISLPPQDECSRMIPNPDGMAEVRVMEGTTVRLDPETMGWARAAHSGVAELRGWASFTNGETIDARSLLYLLDCFPPATFEIHSKGWVPTVQLTAYVRSLPAPGPVKIRQRAQVVVDGFVDEVCEIWDSNDTLVAHAVQLAKVRF